MNQLLMGFIICAVCAIAGLAFGKLSKASSSLSFKELMGKLGGALVPGLIFGAIIGLLLGILSLVTLAGGGVLGIILMTISGAIVGGIISALFTFAGSSPVAGLFCGLALGLLINALLIGFGTSIPIFEYWGAGLEPAGKAIGDAFDELAKYRYCFQVDPRCPFTVDWSDANVQTKQELLQISVNFKENQIKNDNINLLSEIFVQNPEKYELHLIPECFLGEKFDKSRPITIKNMGTYSQGNEFVFPMSSEGLSTSLRCSSSVPECKDKNVCLSQKIFLVLERPVRLQGVWPIYIGQRYYVAGPKQARTELKFNAPFSVSLYSSNDMPFDQGKTYDFNLAVKQKDETTELNEIEIIRLIFPENVLASCEQFSVEGNELVLRNINNEWLKNNAQYDSGERSYLFPCSLYVKQAPIQAELSPIEIESDYTVISKFETKIVKQAEIKFIQ